MRATRHDPGTPGRGGYGATAGRVLASTCLALGLLLAEPSATTAQPSGTLTIGVHVSLAPTWFDPAETAGIITPYLIMYAMHDAMGKPMPHGNPAPSLATKWTRAADGMSYDFTLRHGVKFHDGSTMTPSDVKFSFERYRGAGHALMKSRVKAVELPQSRINAPRSLAWCLPRPI
jgi:peptide/nickel transport system substrate-binding protein